VLLVPAGRLLAGRWREPGRNWDPVRSWASTTWPPNAIAASRPAAGRRRSR